MQNTIQAIHEAHDAAMSAIHQATAAFGDDQEFKVLLHRLQEAGTCLREAELQAVRIKSRCDLDAVVQAASADALTPCSVRRGCTGDTNVNNHIENALDIAMEGSDT